VSIIFDIIFMLQHYVLYQHAQKHIVDGEDHEEEDARTWENDRERLILARTN
jgi:hypothetical protein